MAMPFRACFEYIVSRWTDQLVVTSAGHTSGIWWELTQERERVFYLEASMSLVSMFTAGIAVGLPQRRFWAFTGDGAFAMNPGMLMVERQMALPNVTHFVVSNRCYGATEKVTLPNAGVNDYATVARGFGIKRAFTFDSLESLKSGFDAAIAGPGPTFVALELEPLAERLPAVPVEGPELKYRFGRYIEGAHGIKVFDH